ncbi:hypothetical protein BYT27DRAFT_7252924 [Phlegmacium glaucopus]|nr:hypothetical protein BYT27DRAFT_7252924 [Phlegmacium glaucopus]
MCTFKFNIYYHHHNRRLTTAAAQPPLTTTTPNGHENDDGRLEWNDGEDRWQWMTTSTTMPALHLSLEGCENDN